MISDIDRFLCLLAVCISSLEKCLSPLSIFRNWVVFFFLVVFIITGVLYIFRMQIPYQIHDL